MDIAALSIDLSQLKVQQQVGIYALKEAMNVATNDSSKLSEIMQSVAGNVNPEHLGNNIDILA